MSDVTARDGENDQGMDSDNTLLLVDDDEPLLRRAAKAMEARGFCVSTADSCASALAMITSRPPLFCVVDLRLGDGSGLDVLTALKTRRKDARCIVLSGYADIATAVSAAKLGAHDYLTKPADADEMTASLRAPPGSLPPPPDNPMLPAEKEWSHIRAVLDASGKNISLAARRLQMHRRSLQRIVRRHQRDTI